MTFTLTTSNGTEVPDASVTFTSSASFTGLPGTTSTDAQGRMTVSGLRAVRSGPQTVEVTVDGRTADTTLDVTAATYRLSADPATLTRYEPTDVTFTLKTSNGTEVPDKSIAFTANPDLELNASTETTNTGGKVTIQDLRSMDLQPKVVQAVVDGQPLSVQLSFTQGDFLLEANPTALTQHETQNVTFTLKTASGTPVPNASATFAANPTLGLAASTKATDGNGQIRNVPLTATVAGSQTVQITVDGQTESVAFTVAPATYNLSVSPQKLIQHVGTDVTFTIKRNNKTVSGLAATFATNVDLGLNGTTRNTDGSGRITLRLTPTATGTKTVQVTVDGQALNAGLQVDPPSYTLETSDSLSQHDPKDVTFTVKRNGQLVSGLSVVFTANADLGLTAVTQRTNGSGQVTVTGLKSATAGQKAVEVTVDNLGKADTTLTVTPATYKLVPSITSLTQYEPENVTFTLTTAKGTIVPNMNVSFTSSANSNFTGLPAAVSTDGSGQIPVNPLTTKDYTTSQTVTATVDGKNVTAQFTVTEATFLLTATPAKMVQYEKESTTFTLTTSKGTKVPGLNVTFQSSAAFANTSGTHTPDTNGAFTLSDLIATASGEQTIAVTVNGRKNATTKLRVAKLTFDITSVTNGGDFVSGGTSRASLTGQLKADGTPYAPKAQTQVVWSVTAATNNSKAVESSHKSRKTGLAWGTSGPGASAGNDVGTTTNTISGSSPITVNLTDVMGERTVTVRAEVKINGYSFFSTQTKDISFGKGPLSVFAGEPHGNTDANNIGSICKEYQGGSSKRPLVTQLTPISGSKGNYAYLAAGWPDDKTGNGDFIYWTRTSSGSTPWIINLDDAYDRQAYQGIGNIPVIVCLP